MNQLSAHFYLEEFTASQTAARLGREIVPTPEQLSNLTRLCESLLEPIRVRLQRPIVITSGLRPPWLNELIGGSPRSAHMDGLAADVKVVGMSPSVFQRWVRNQGFTLDQCIEEFGQWAHLSVAAAGATPRQQFLIARTVNGKTTYTETPP